MSNGCFAITRIAAVFTTVLFIRRNNHTMTPCNALFVGRKSSGGNARQGSSENSAAATNRFLCARLLPCVGLAQLVPSYCCI